MLTRDVETRHHVWSSRDAFQYCERITYDHYENFPVASLLLPRDRRKYVCAVYAFARTADDFADEPGLTTAERIESLNEWEEHLNESLNDSARNPVFVALAETIDRFQIPPELFRNLLQAFREDVTVHRYESFDDVLRYCRNSANPVGRIILLMFNYRSDSLLQLSDSICTALQLANFWQDIRVDLEKDRIYVPREDMRDFGYTEEEFVKRMFTPQFAHMLSFEVERTREFFFKGKPLVAEVGKDLAWELTLTWNGGMRILEKIEQLEYNVFRVRPKLTFPDKLRLLITSLIKKRQ
ncbi:MAG: squalene synthase HpnC [Ignavibacteriales bacterium]|nr:squalene synthase HpnC [Ignavibacteriales bacterium]